MTVPRKGPSRSQKRASEHQSNDLDAKRLIFIISDAGFQSRVRDHSTHETALLQQLPASRLSGIPLPDRFNRPCLLFVLKRLDGIIAEDGKEVEEDTSIELSINGDIIQRRFSSAISLQLASHMVEYGIGSAVESTRILGSLPARSTVKDQGLLIMRAGVCYMRLALYDNFVVKKGKLTA